MSYKAIVCSIKTQPHPNADRLQVGTVMGETVVVGMNVQDGDLGIYFPADGQLSDEVCKLLDLYPRTDENGQRNAGYISERDRRVKAIKLRGVNSYGIWLSLEAFEPVLEAQRGLASMAFYEGDQFDTIGTMPLCNKYVSPATLRARAAGINAKQPKAEHPLLPQHQDTENWARNRDRISKLEGAVFTVTRKLHGTSQRSACVPYQRPLRWYERPFAWLFGLVPPTAEKLVHGTRRVAKENFAEPFRREAADAVAPQLPLGWAAYYEVVGWETPERPIMSRVDPAQHSKALAKQYPGQMTYTYGCKPGQHNVYVYHIITPQKIHLSYDQIKAWCDAESINVVPLLYHGTDLAEVDRIVAAETEGPDTIDPSHIREGVVVRVDHRGDTWFFKNKSHTFLVLEGVAKAEDVVDTEEAA